MGGVCPYILLRVSGLGAGGLRKYAYNGDYEGDYMG